MIFLHQMINYQFDISFCNDTAEKVSEEITDDDVNLLQTLQNWLEALLIDIFLKKNIKFKNNKKCNNRTVTKFLAYFIGFEPSI